MRAVVFGAVCGMACAAGAHAATVDAYAYSVAVQSACATSGPSPNITATGLNVPSSPYQQSPCTAGQDLHTASRATQTATARSTIAGSGNSSNGTWSDSGLSGGRGGYGTLQVKAHDAKVGSGDGFTRTGHEAFGRIDDTLTFTNGSGAGVAHLVFTTTGHASVPRFGVDLELDVWLNNPVYATMMMRLFTGGSPISLVNDGAYVDLVHPPPTVRAIKNGYALQSLQSHIDLPFTYGAPAPIRALLYGWAETVGSNADSLTYVADVVGATKLTGITVDGNAAPVIVSGSGTAYPVK